jgi:hypothetical protein
MLIDFENFNRDQAKGLSNLFFDIAKALILGTVVINVVSSAIIVKFLMSAVEIILAVGCIRIALDLLKDNQK